MRDCEKCGTKNEDNASFCINCSHPLKAKDTVGGVQTAPLPSTKPSGKSETDPNLELEPGHLFADRYEIVDKIGQGGMGTVYHAKDTIGANRDIALKLIKGSLLVDQVARDRLIHEGVLTQDIRHSNVVAVHNVGVHNEQPFVAMAYVEGVSMREWLIRNFNYRNEQGLREDIPFPIVAKIIHAILDGLEAAHELGIVHRDLKPENIILTAEPNEAGAALQILDFGIARAPGPPLSTASGGMGTQGYMAPEQLTNPAGVDGSADLYSLSRMFYEMLMRAVPSGEIQDPSGGRTDVPKGIDALIRKGLSDDAGRRPQTVAEYRAALKKAVGNGQTGGRKGPSRKDIDKGKNIPPPPPPPEVPRTLVIGGGIGLAFVAVVGILNIPTDDFERGETSSSSSSSSTSSTLSSGGNTTSSSSFGGDDPPPPPPPPPDLSRFSGSWVYNDGSSIPVSVDSDGYFSSEGFDPNGAPYAIEGDLTAGEFVFTTSAGSLSGTIVQQDECHFDYRLYYPNGAPGAGGRIHVNHPPTLNGCP